MKGILAALLVLVVAGCARTSVMPVAQDVVQINVRASAWCGAGGAQQAATQLAAAETLKRGFDSFIIVGANDRSDVTYSGSGSSYSSGFGSWGLDSTTTHVQNVTVKMFAAGDPAAVNALSAKDIAAVGGDGTTALGRTSCM